MRLLAVSHTGLRSGAETVLARAVEGARARGWAVAVATPTGPFAGQLDDAGFQHVTLPELKLPAGPRPAAVVELGRRWVAAAPRLRRAAAWADVVLVNGFLALPAVRLARPAAPVAFLVHDVLRRGDQRAVLRASAGAVDLAIAVSDAVAAPLRAAGLETVVVRNGTTWPAPHAPTEPEQPPVVGCAAVLTSWKGQDVLLEAIARLGRPDVTVELAGGAFPKDGPYAESLRRRAAQPDLAGRVRFLGHVDDLLGRMRHWTVAVSASVDPEAAPLNVLEAMSVGVPVVGTDHGGTPEVLGDAGLLVPPRDPEAMARAIARLLEDTDLRERCALAGPRLVAAGLTLDRWEDELLATLSDLAAGDGVHARSPRRARRRAARS